MSKYLGDFAADATVRVYFTTNAADGGRESPSDTFEVADFRIYKNGVATARSSQAGWTYDNEVDAMTGAHCLSIDLSDDTDAGFYAAGSEYAVILYPDETVDSQSIAAVLGQFSIERTNGATVLAIKAKTDTIGTVEMTAVSPTIVNDTFTIYAGDDYADADGRALTVTGVDASDFDLEASGVEVVFRLLKWTDYRQDDTTEAELEATATVDEVDGDGLATLSVELTADQTGALATSPPQPEKNYAFQWIATLESGRTVLLASGRMTVVKRLTDAS